MAWQQAQAARSSSGGGGGRSSGGGTPTTTGTAPSYNQVKQDYIKATQAGVTASERKDFLDATVNAGYISQSEANKIEAIYKAPTKNYTAVDQMWDRHS